MLRRPFKPITLVFMNYRNFSSLQKVILKDNKFFRSNILLPKRDRFHEPTPRGYEYPYPPSDHTLTDYFHIGRKRFLGEVSLWIEEVREKFRNDPKYYVHGDTEVIFRFDSETIKKWGCSSDKANKEGNSEGSLVLTNSGTGLFSGNIDNVVPKDGKAKRTGFVAIRSKKLLKSFVRLDSYDWEDFTHLELRVRGDGRTYTVLIGLNNYFDLMWLDIFTYPLFTRGGPYWETIRIPFSKFFLTSKGRIQDNQDLIPKYKINCVGIQVMAIPGPFKIEIDYIGVHLDETETEEFAYEKYNYPKYLVSI